MAYVTCKYCHQKDLLWFKDEDGSFHLIDDSGARHSCKGQYNAKIPDYIRQLEQPEQVKPAEPPPDVLAQVMMTIDKRVDDKLDNHTTELVSIGTDGMKQLANKRAEVIEESVREAIKAAEARIPVKHLLEIKSEHGIIQVEGHPHHLLPQLISFANARLHVFMVGPAGGGKTTAGQQCATALSLPYYESSMGPNTSAWDLIGYRSPEGKYIPGIMRQPYEHGGILMLDEIDNSNPSVLTTLNSALSNHRYTFPDCAVDKHKDFICIAAGNTYGLGADRLYVGRNQLDAATLDRFATVNWDYDEEAEKQWAGVDQLSWVEYVQNVRHITQKHQMRVVVSPRASIFGARLLRCNVERKVVAEAVLWKGISRDDRQKIEVELQTIQPIKRSHNKVQVQIIGCDGDRKINCIKLLRETFDLDLYRAKKIIDDVLMGEKRYLELDADKLEDFKYVARSAGLEVE